jgi:pimeloyl-ACP methyl ester carboxylesterase
VSDTPSQPIDQRADVVRSYRPIAELIPDHWQAGDVLANGISQRYYRTGGDKPPVVLLHGIMEGALVWLPTAHELEADYDVIMLDTRGHGHSARAGDDYTHDTLAADAAGAIAALGLSDVRLLGFSQGANTAALVADRHPELLRAVVLAGLAEAQPTGGPPSDMMSSPQYREWLNAYNAWLEGLKTQSHTERMVASLSQVPPFAPLSPEGEYVAWVENSANLDLELVRSAGKLWGSLPAAVQAMEEAMGRLSMPTLIMKSNSAPYSSGPLTVRELPSDQPNVKVVFFENTGHVIYRDRFEAFVEQVREFFAQV